MEVFCCSPSCKSLTAHCWALQLRHFATYLATREAPRGFHSVFFGWLAACWGHVQKMCWSKPRGSSESLPIMVRDLRYPQLQIAPFQEPISFIDLYHIHIHTYFSLLLEFSARFLSKKLFNQLLNSLGIGTNSPILLYINPDEFRKYENHLQESKKQQRLDNFLGTSILKPVICPSPKFCFPLIGDDDLNISHGRHASTGTCRLKATDENACKNAIWEGICRMKYHAIAIRYTPRLWITCSINLTIQALQRHTIKNQDYT